MSTTTVLGVTPDRRPVTLLTLHNAWGWSPSIWARLIGVRFAVLDGPRLDRLWGSIEDLPDWQQVPLVLTFDTGVIPWFAYSWAADQLERFDREMPERDGSANHVLAVAELLRSGPEAPFVGIWGTSVSENPFDPWDEERDEPGSGISARAYYVLAQHRDRLLAERHHWEKRQ